MTAKGDCATTHGGLDFKLTVNATTKIVQKGAIIMRLPGAPANPASKLCHTSWKAVVKYRGYFLRHCRIVVLLYK